MESWKDDILRSMEGAQRATPDPELFVSIQARIAQTGRMTVVKRPYLALTAACLGLLIMANIALLNNRYSNSNTPSMYQIEVANFNLY